MNKNKRTLQSSQEPLTIQCVVKEQLNKYINKSDPTPVALMPTHKNVRARRHTNICPPNTHTRRAWCEKRYIMILVSKKGGKWCVHKILGKSIWRKCQDTPTYKNTCHITSKQAGWKAQLCVWKIKVHKLKKSQKIQRTWQVTTTRIERTYGKIRGRGSERVHDRKKRTCHVTSTRAERIYANVIQHSRGQMYPANLKIFQCTSVHIHTHTHTHVRTHTNTHIYTPFKYIDLSALEHPPISLSLHLCISLFLAHFFWSVFLSIWAKVKVWHSCRHTHTHSHSLRTESEQAINS